MSLSAERLASLIAEHLVSLTDAAASFPGGPVHVRTLHRWHVSGLKGVRLETIVRAGERFTSHEAIERFITATTKAADAALQAAAS